MSSSKGAEWNPERDRVVAQIITRVFEMGSDDVFVSIDGCDVTHFGVTEWPYNNLSLRPAPVHNLAAGIWDPRR